MSAQSPGMALIVGRMRESPGRCNDNLIGFHCIKERSEPVGNLGLYTVEQSWIVSIDPTSIMGYRRTLGLEGSKLTGAPDVTSQ